MENDIEQFLKTISEIESGNGKYTDHKKMQSGIHAGESAMGNYGLMPNTVREIVNREKLVGNNKLDSLLELDGEQLKDYLSKNPQVEKELATSLAKKVLGKFQDPEQAAYAWNQGHNLTPEKLKERNYQNSEYVKRFKEAEALNRKPASEDQLMLASKSGASQPGFANESGEVNTEPNALVEKWNEYQSWLDKQTEPSDEMKPIFEGMPDMTGLIGPGPKMIGGVAKMAPMIAEAAPAIAEEVTSIGRAVPKMMSKLPGSIQELIEQARGNGKLMSIGEEASLLKEKDPILKSYNQMNKRTSSVMDNLFGKRSESVIEALPENHSYADAPIADIETKQRALELLKKKY